MDGLSKLVTSVVSRKIFFEIVGWGRRGPSIQGGSMDATCMGSLIPSMLVTIPSKKGLVLNL